MSYFDGHLVDAEIYVKNGVSYVELKKIVELLFYKVSWDGEKKEVSMVNDQNQYKFSVNKNTAYINSQEITLSVAPEITNSKTFLPVRFLREVMGLNVFWDSNHNAVLIETSII